MVHSKSMFTAALSSLASVIFLIAALSFSQGVAAQAEGSPPPDAAHQFPNSTNATSIVGTWSSGSQRVLTGQNGTTMFFNPFQQRVTIPETPGISYSFTEDGYFETAKYKYESNPQRLDCFKISLTWQHGRYHIDPKNGSIIMVPFGPDGYVQTMGRCETPQVTMNNFQATDLIRQWYNYLDVKPGFNDDAPSMYAMQFYQFNGEPLPLMYQVYNPPNMLPTEQLFMAVISS